ncbi:MAG: nickel pincer cofactor biosynthesis protein LarC [Haloferacaceae archaeon]
MRVIAFDGRTGAAGDMLLGALLAAGADRDALAPVEDGLSVRYEVSEASTEGVRATNVDVVLDDPSGAGSSPPTSAEGHGPSRSHTEVVEIVEGLDLPDPVESDALAVFQLLAEAEAAIHGVDVPAVHFHEVGADDAIADVVGTCLLFADLNPDRVVTTPLSAGGGEVSTNHGTYPVPAPAVVELAERADWRLVGGPVDRELLTPTGAAILGHFAEGVEALPELSVTGSGYGAGDADLGSRPNVLRAIVGRDAGRLRREEITVLETNLDDATPEILGGLHDRLAEAGALDVSVLPATMKKSRPGHLVKVVCRPGDARRVARALAIETGTLGVREHGAGHRWVADRRVEAVELSVDGRSYEVDVKVASTEDGAVYDVSAEYDDVAAVASETGLASREVARRAERGLAADLNSDVRR